MIVLMTLACTRGIAEPDRAGCVETVEGDDQADGTIDSLQTEQWDAEGRVIAVTTEVDGYDYERTVVYEGDCAVETRERTEYLGTTYTFTTTALCDDNGDPVSQDVEQRGRGEQVFDYAYTSEWDREYGENGLSVAALRVDTYPGDFEILAEETWTYDDRDRVVRHLVVRDDSARLVTTVFSPEHPELDLVTATETRDGFGVLTEGTYLSYDERGRKVVERILDADRTERVFESVWEKRRYALVEASAARDGEVEYTVDFTHDDGRPWLERTASYDGYDGNGPDGEVDYRQTTTVDCSD